MSLRLQRMVIDGNNSVDRREGRLKITTATIMEGYVTDFIAGGARQLAFGERVFVCFCRERKIGVRRMQVTLDYYRKFIPLSKQIFETI